MPREPRDPPTPADGCSDSPAAEATPHSRATAGAVPAALSACDLLPTIVPGDLSPLEEPSVAGGAPGVVAGSLDESPSPLTFDFTSLGAYSSLDVLVGRAIDTYSFADATLQVRVIALTIPRDAMVECVVRATSEREELGTEFVDPTPLGKMRLNRLDSGVATPCLQVALGARLAPFVQTMLKVTRGFATGAFRLTLSLCLVHRRAAASVLMRRA